MFSYWNIRNNIFEVVLEFYFLSLQNLNVVRLERERERNVNVDDRDNYNSDMHTGHGPWVEMT